MTAPTKQKKSPEQIEFDQQLEAVLATEEGRRILWWIMDISGTFALNLNPVDQGRDMMEGRRCIGLTVFQLLTPEIFLKMQTEATRRNENAQRPDPLDRNPFNLLDDVRRDS